MGIETAQRLPITDHFLGRRSVEPVFKSQRWHLCKINRVSCQQRRTVFEGDARDAEIERADAARLASGAVSFFAVFMAAT
jgi:hypothetical protein